MYKILKLLLISLVDLGIFSILFPPSITPLCWGPHISCVCLFTWPETWLFSIGGNYHMIRGSFAILYHQVVELVVVLCSRINDVSTFSSQDQFIRATYPFTQRKNWRYSLISLNGAQAQQTYFKKSVSRIRGGVDCYEQSNSWHTAELILGLLKPIIMKRTLFLTASQPGCWIHCVNPKY